MSSAQFYPSSQIVATKSLAPMMGEIRMPAKYMPNTLYGGAVGVQGQDRQRMNLVSISLNVLAPWFLFAVLFAVTSFNIRYEHPYFALDVVLLGLAIVVLVGLAAFVPWRHINDDDRSRTWYVFCFCALASAWLLACVGGSSNFAQNTVPYHRFHELNQYAGIDVSKESGQRLQDAGRMFFAKDTKLDFGRAMAFKDEDVYCVAPIAAGGSEKMASYDFWAVGMNCCSGLAADFHCGEYKNVHAKAGLRLLHDDQRPFYRLAVQQAEAMYNITAAHPLFFEWMQDPDQVMNKYMDDSMRFYLQGVIAFFVLNLFCVTVAAIGFSKGHGDDF